MLGFVPTLMLKGLHNSPQISEPRSKSGLGLQNERCAWVTHSDRKWVLTDVSQAVTMVKTLPC